MAQYHNNSNKAFANHLSLTNLSIIRNINSIYKTNITII